MGSSGWAAGCRGLAGDDCMVVKSGGVVYVTLCHWFRAGGVMGFSGPESWLVCVVLNKSAGIFWLGCMIFYADPLQIYSHPAGSCLIITYALPSLSLTWLQPHTPAGRMHLSVDRAAASHPESEPHPLIYGTGAHA
jgi:hypothetical protein